MAFPDAIFALVWAGRQTGSAGYQGTTVARIPKNSASRSALGGVSMTSRYMYRRRWSTPRLSHRARHRGLTQPGQSSTARRAAAGARRSCAPACSTPPRLIRYRSTSPLSLRAMRCPCRTEVNANTPSAATRVARATRPGGCRRWSGAAAGAGSRRRLFFHSGSKLALNTPATTCSVEPCLAQRVDQRRTAATSVMSSGATQQSRAEYERARRGRARHRSWSRSPQPATQAICRRGRGCRGPWRRPAAPGAPPACSLVAVSRVCIGARTARRHRARPCPTARALLGSPGSADRAAP